MQNTRTFRKMFFPAIAGTVAIGAVSALRAQAPAADTKPSAFEVASVKPNKSGDQHITVHVQSGGRFTATNITLHLVIRRRPCEWSLDFYHGTGTARPQAGMDPRASRCLRDRSCGTAV